MMLLMMKTDQKYTLLKSTPHPDEGKWSALFANIRELAMRKSERMLRNDNLDEDDAGRDARSLRTLMGSAEVAARLKHLDEKEQSPDGETQRPYGQTEEELDEVFERVRARIDRLAAEESARGGGSAHPDSERGAGRSAGRERREGVA